MCFLLFALPLRLGQREGKVPEQFTDTFRFPVSRCPRRRIPPPKAHVSCRCGGEGGGVSSASAAFSMICLISLNDKEQNVQMNMNVRAILQAGRCATQALMGENVSHVGKVVVVVVVMNERVTECEGGGGGEVRGRRSDISLAVTDVRFGLAAAAAAA